MSSKKKVSGSTATMYAPATPRSTATSSPTWKYAPYVALMAFAVLLYGNTLWNKYALDDSIVITDNRYTTMSIKFTGEKGDFTRDMDSLQVGLGKIFTTDAFEGFFKTKKDLVEGGRYRPLSIATFALEWYISPKDPALSHAGNIVLYAILGMALFAFLRMLFPEKDPNQWWLGIPFIITILFMAHPIHTEVVANIKGRDELMAMLFLVLSMLAAFKYVDGNKIVWLAVAFVSFFLGLLSKETPLPFVLILPLSLLFFRAGIKPLQIVLATLPVVLATVVYLAIRLKYVGLGGGAGSELGTEILNDPFIGTTLITRLPTVMETWGMYLVKLFVPVQLSHDYYYNQIPVTTWANPLALLGAVTNLALIGLGIWLTTKRNAIGYGILFYYLSFSITSNLLISIGVTMGERFVFVASLGFLIAVVMGLQALLQRFKVVDPKTLLYIALGVSALFALKTVVRNTTWKDNYTLFTTDAETSPNSAKVQTAAGGVMIERADDPKTGPQEKTKLYNGAIKHLERAVKIYPEHGNAWLLMGNAKHKLEDYAGSLAAYEKVIVNRPRLWDAYKNAAITARKIKRYDLAEGYFRREIAAKDMATPKVLVGADLWFDRGNNFEEWGTKPDSAIWAYNIAAQMDPKMAKAYGQIGRVYGMQLNNLDQAIVWGEKAVAIDPKLDWVYENIGIATAMKGDPTGALAVFQRGLAVSPNSAKLHKNIGITYQSLGDLTQAEASFARARQIDPNLR